MKFNSASCVENRCLLHGIPSFDFAISSKVKDKIRTEKFIIVNNDIDIKPISAKHFFQIVSQKDYKSYM